MDHAIPDDAGDDFFAGRFLANQSAAAAIRTDLPAGQKGAKKTGGDVLSGPVQGPDAAAADRGKRAVTGEAERLRSEMGEGGGPDCQGSGAKGGHRGYGGISARGD